MKEVDLAQFLRSLLAAVAAAAVDKDDLVPVRQLFRRFRSDTFIRNADGAGNMAGIELILPPDVHDDMFGRSEHGNAKWRTSATALRLSPGHTVKRIDPFHLQKANQGKDEPQCDLRKDA